MGLFGKKKKKSPLPGKTAKVLLKLAAKGIHPHTAAVIVAAGSASRMEGIDKIFTPLGGVTVLEQAIAPFMESKLVQEVVVVTRWDAVPRAEMMLSARNYPKPLTVVKGGDTRTASVLAGLAACSEKTRVVAVHDGARPLVTREIVEETIKTAAKTAAAAPAVAVKDTIKVAQDGVITHTPDRSTLFAVQTPQTFALELLQAGIASAQADGVSLTDDCSAVEHLGVPVHLTAGSYENLKITTPEDLWMAETILRRRKKP